MPKREKREKRLVKCIYCGYTWYTRAKTMYVTCPSCMRKTPVLPREQGKPKVKAEDVRRATEAEGDR